MMKACRLFIPFSMLAVTSCFTGVESTPKITASELKKQQVYVTEEDKFLSDINPQRLSEWKSGKRFYVTDDKIMLALEPSQTSPTAGETLYFVDYRPVTSLTGTDDTEIILKNKSGNEVIYRISASPAELDKRSKVEIPFTIDMDIVDEASRSLTGNSYYLKNSVRYDENGNSYGGTKFVPVKILEVAPGNVVYQLRLKFEVEDSVNKEQSYLFLNVGESGRSSRNFSSLFYFKDPRLKYPAITDENWHRIQHGQVAKYMTREECKLSLGAPATVNRRNAISTIQELWSYPNGNYLIFEDGLLQSMGK